MSLSWQWVGYDLDRSTVFGSTLLDEQRVEGVLLARPRRRPLRPLPGNVMPAIIISRLWAAKGVG
jgi:hypothetical protein